MTASSDQNRNVPLTARRTIATKAMRTAAARVPAARTFSTLVNTLLKRVMRHPGGEGSGSPVTGLPDRRRLLLLTQELCDEVLTDHALVLRPDLWDHGILECLALGRGWHQDRGLSGLLDLSFGGGVHLGRDLAVVGAGLVSGVLHGLLQVLRQLREPRVVHYEHITDVAVVGLGEVRLHGVHLL